MSKYANHTLEIREITGMSQLEAAGMLGISREALALYETGKRPRLPRSAGLLEGSLIVEMNKPENQQAIVPTVLSETSRQRLQKKLSFISSEKRYQAGQVQREIDKCLEKQTARQKRLLLVPCLEKVHAALLEKSKGTNWQPVSEHQKHWLEMVKGFSSFNEPDEESFIQKQLLQLKYKTLMHGAEEAERMIEELG